MEWDGLIIKNDNALVVALSSLIFKVLTNKEMSKDTTQTGITIPDVRFNLRSLKDKNKATLIVAIFRYAYDPGIKKGRRLVYSTKNKIEPKHWDFKKQWPRSSYNFYFELKGELDKIEKAIKSTYQKDRNIEIDLFKSRLDIELGRTNEVKKDPKTLTGFIEAFIKRREKLEDKSTRTIQKYKTTFERLKQYQSYTGNPIDFEDMNNVFKEDYLYWLYNVSGINSRNTANKEFATIKMFLNEAKESGFNEFNYYQSKKFGVSRVKTTKIALTEDEVKRLENLDLSGNSHFEMVRDWFLVACYTSLRWSDFSEITKANIVTIEGDLCIHKWSKKNTEEVYIPINEKLLIILQKYDYKSPTFVPQVFNRTIKKVCELAGIVEVLTINKDVKGKTTITTARKCDEISSHHGRRYWATHHYLKGYPILLLMQVTGHTKESTFMGYIGVSKKYQAKALLREKKKRKRDESNIVRLHGT